MPYLEVDELSQVQDAASATGAMLQVPHCGAGNPAFAGLCDYPNQPSSFAIESLQ